MALTAKERQIVTGLEEIAQDAKRDPSYPISWPCGWNSGKGRRNACRAPKRQAADQTDNSPAAAPAAAAAKRRKSAAGVITSLRDTELKSPSRILRSTERKDEEDEGHKSMRGQRSKKKKKRAVEAEPELSVREDDATADHNDTANDDDSDMKFCAFKRILDRKPRSGKQRGTPMLKIQWMDDTETWEPAVIILEDDPESFLDYAIEVGLEKCLRWGRQKSLAKKKGWETFEKDAKKAMKDQRKGRGKPVMDTSSRELVPATQEGGAVEANSNKTEDKHDETSTSKDTAKTLHLESEICSLKRRVVSREKRIAELTKANCELQCSLDDSKGDLEDAQETIKQQHLFVDCLHSKIDDLATLAADAGVDGHKIQSIRYRSPKLNPPDL